MRLVRVVDADALMGFDISSEELETLTKAVGAKIAELTGMPLEDAVLLAVSVACCRIVDEEGNLLFHDAEEREVVRLPYAAFADVLDDEEEGDDDACTEDLNHRGS
jgi:hypothetical protein